MRGVDLLAGAIASDPQAHPLVLALRRADPTLVPVLLLGDLAQVRVYRLVLAKQRLLTVAIALLGHIQVEILIRDMLIGAELVVLDLHHPGQLKHLFEGNDGPLILT